MNVQMNRPRTIDSHDGLPFKIRTKKCRFGFLVVQFLIKMDLVSCC